MTEKEENLYYVVAGEKFFIDLSQGTYLARHPKQAKEQFVKKLGYASLEEYIKIKKVDDLRVIRIY